MTPPNSNETEKKTSLRASRGDRFTPEEQRRAAKPQAPAGKAGRVEPRLGGKAPEEQTERRVAMPPMEAEEMPLLPRKRMLASNHAVEEGGDPYEKRPRVKAPKGAKQPRPSWKWRLTKWCLKWGIVAGIWATIALMGGVLYYAHGLPDLDRLGAMKKARKVTLISDTGEVLANYGDLYAEYMPYEKAPKILIDAVLATEDRRFFSHMGVDPIGLLRAAYTNYRAGHVVQGGSTVTQQLAKIMFLSPERTMKRKIQEVLFALYLERKFSKEEIITLYLNRVYMGAGIYGVSAAAKYYFGKDISEVSLYEAATIAGLLKAPSRYSPVNNAERSAGRAYQILLNMEDAGFITKEQVAEAQKHPVVLETSAMGSLKNLYFADWVMEQIPDFISDTESDITVRTTLNPQMQQLAETAAAKVMAEKGPGMKASQSAVVTLSPDGKVLAMVGGLGYDKSPFNRATKAMRQPGSSFKMFVYLTAFEQGYTPESEMVDMPITIKRWQPKNYEGKYEGKMPLRQAFAKSINTVAVQLSERVGRNNVIHTAHRLGINSQLAAHPSIALGSTEVNLLELTGSYATVANNGEAVWPYGIEEIADKNGTVLYKRQGSGLDRVISPKAEANILDVLSAVTSSGTGKAAQLDRPAAGKTGTTSDYRDAWFIGFTADYVTGVWVGNDNNQPMKKVTGGSLPAQIWKAIMMEANKGLPVRALASGNPGHGDMRSPADNPQEGGGMATEGEKKSFWEEIMDSVSKDSESKGKVEFEYPSEKRR